MPLLGVVEVCHFECGREGVQHVSIINLSQALGQIGQVTPRGCDGGHPKVAETGWRFAHDEFAVFCERALHPSDLSKKGWQFGTFDQSAASLQAPGIRDDAGHRRAAVLAF